MCLTPTISILTAIIEFIIATFIIFHYKKSSISKVVAILIYFLGIYQLTEFMICTSQSPLLWAKIGFITYTFLPAIGLEFCLRVVKKKHKTFLIFLLPVIFSIYAISKENFIIKAICESYHISVRNVLFESSISLLPLIYMIYYFGFIGFTIYLFYKHYLNSKNKVDKGIDKYEIFGIIISMIPAIILLFIFPKLNYAFPSVYCQFSIIFAIVTLIVFHKEKQKSF